MTTEGVAEVFESLKEATGADDAAAATLTLAYYVGKLTTFSGGDMLAHGIALGVRNGLMGNSSGPETDFGAAVCAIADAIRDAGNAVGGER